MQTLATVTTVFAFVAIAIHVYIWIIESFLWTKPRGRETFGMTEEFAESTKEMAANQGLYNLMLAWIAATGLLAFWFGSPAGGRGAPIRRPGLHGGCRCLPVPHLPG